MKAECMYTLLIFFWSPSLYMNDILMYSQLASVYIYIYIYIYICKGPWISFHCFPTDGVPRTVCMYFQMVTHLLGNAISNLEIQWMSFPWSVNYFGFHSVKHVGFQAKESVFAWNLTALLYSNEICSWSTQNSCWDLLWPCFVSNNMLRLV